MTSLADSNAVLVEGNLPQHQAALTILQGMLSDPARTSLRWLDLGCGKGQIISNLEHNLAEAARRKIELVGFDVNVQYSKQAKRIAQQKGLASTRFEVGELREFWNNPATAGPWDFLSLTNTTHEIDPDSLAAILAHSIERLSDSGCLFLYDMERLPTPELGAIPWSAAEIKNILSTMLRELGSRNSDPPVGQWKHRTTTGWNAQLRRQHLLLPNGFIDRIPAAIAAGREQITLLLRNRLERTNTALESLAEFGPETAEEEAERGALLHEYWAVHRALGSKS
jgi:SAM-dependent methyltransferase